MAQRCGRRLTDRLAADEWQQTTVTPLVVLAAAGLALDATTTYLIVVLPGFEERNLFLRQLAAIHPVVAPAWQLVFAGAYVYVAALSLGWVSTAAGSAIVVTNGVLGVSNLVLLATGTSLFTWVGVGLVTAALVFTPTTGVVVGLLAEWYRHGLPWREVGVAASVYLVAELALLVL